MIASTLGACDYLVRGLGTAVLTVIEGDPSHALDHFSENTEKAFYHLYFNIICIRVVFTTVMTRGEAIRGFYFNTTPEVIPPEPVDHTEAVEEATRPLHERIQEHDGQIQLLRTQLSEAIAGYSDLPQEQRHYIEQAFVVSQLQQAVDQAHARVVRAEASARDAREGRRNADELAFQIGQLQDELRVMTDNVARLEGERPPNRDHYFNAMRDLNARSRLIPELAPLVAEMVRRHGLTELQSHEE